MKRFTTLIFLTFLLGAIQMNAQTFNAYLALGSNITEANLTKSGNSQIGTRIGLNIGPGVTATINRRWETSMELLYSQNGYYVDLTQIQTVPLDKIVLHFVEVPLTLSYRLKTKKNQKENFSKLILGGGITYARLVNYKIIAVNGVNLTDDIRFDQEQAILFNFAATSFIGESFALNGRATLSTFGKWTFALRLLFYI